MSTRTVELLRGKETVLSVHKGAHDDASPSYIVLNCATDVNYGGQVETLTANCYGGVEKISSGNTPDYTISVNGVAKEYLTANVAANVSSKELEGWFQTGVVKIYKLARPHEGDTVRTFKATITAYSENGSSNGLTNYSITLTPLTMPALSTVPA